MIKKSFIKTLAAFMLPVALVSCKEEEITKSNTLEVAPASNIEFLAKDNEDVVLTVTTDADSWSYKAPEWVVATQDGNKLTVNAQENTEADSRIGRIEFTAGNADKVTVNVSQEGAGSVDPTDIVGSLVDENGGTEGTITVEKENNLTVKVIFKLDKVAESDMEAKLFVDAEYLNEYNFTHEAECELFPVENITIPAEGKIVVAKGKQESEPVEVALDASALGLGRSYLIPLCTEAVSEGLVVKSDTKRVNYVADKKNPKEIKNVLYFEINDVNPLNALEYELEDGQNFFDAIILFAANINYNSIEDRVYLSNNPNVQALLDETDVYLQPLRKKGIKVYLGLLGNHDAAGLCQLSNDGCRMWAQEVADAMLEYKLDGVNLDDEYSSYPTDNPWFAPSSQQQGSRLCYDLQRAMNKTVPWDTEVSVFRYGDLSGLSSVTINSSDYTEALGEITVDPEEEGMTFQPGEFVDFWVANYGGSTNPAEGMTLKQCSANSIELNRGYGSVTEDDAKRYKEQGYGWLMWFAYNPDPTHSLYNKDRALPSFKNTAKGFYGVELKEPTGYYKKISEGVYDPNRYEY